MNIKYSDLKQSTFTLLAIVLSMVCFDVCAQTYDFFKSTPIGSWQVREESVTNHKGKESIQVIRSSLVGKEQVDGSPHFWLELEMDQFVVKKGKRKQKGKTMIVKTLVPKDELQGQMKSAFNLKNLQAVANKVIMQNGNQKPMLIEGAGFLADAMLRALGVSIDYQFEPAGKETIKVPAGSFKTHKVQASGDIETKVLIKKLKVESDMTIWLSNAVPFGLVKSEGANLVNGKQQKIKATLIKYGKSGAKTKITREPTVMPGAPFGGGS